MHSLRPHPQHAASLSCVGISRMWRNNLNVGGVTQTCTKIYRNILIDFCMISIFHLGFQDFVRDFLISAVISWFHSWFPDFDCDFWFQPWFQATVYEISLVAGPSSVAVLLKNSKHTDQPGRLHTMVRSSAVTLQYMAHTLTCARQQQTPYNVSNASKLTFNTKLFTSLVHVSNTHAQRPVPDIPALSHLCIHASQQ